MSTRDDLQAIRARLDSVRDRLAYAGATGDKDTRSRINAVVALIVRAGDTLRTALRLIEGWDDDATGDG